MQQQGEPGHALHHGADRRRGLRAAQDEVALPIAGYRPVGDLRWALADVDHVQDAAAAFIGASLWFASRAPGAQVFMQLTAQAATALHINRLIDRLVGHPHLQIIGKVPGQPSGDLLETVLVVESSLHLIVEPLVEGQLARPGPTRPLLSTRLRRTGPIPRGGLPTAAPLRADPIPCSISTTAERIPLDL